MVKLTCYRDWWWQLYSPIPETRERISIIILDMINDFTFRFYTREYLSNYKHRRILFSFLFFSFSFPKSHHPLDGSDTRNEGLVWAARGMIRSRSGTIALCVAGKRRKIIDHGPVNMNGRSGSNRPGATLLRRICKKGTGHRGPHATQAFPISPDSLCSGFSEEEVVNNTTCF